MYYKLNKLTGHLMYLEQALHSSLDLDLLNNHMVLTFNDPKQEGF